MGQIILLAKKEENHFETENKIRQVCEPVFIVKTINTKDMLFSFLNNSLPEIIILDPEIQKEDKWNFVQEVHDLVTEKEIPLVLLSDFTDELFLDKASNIGIDDFISPGIGDVELKLRINSILHRQNLSDKIRKQEGQLREFALIANRTGNSIIIINTDGELEWVNDAFVSLYEYTFENFIENFGTNILNTQFFNQITRESFQKCVRKGETVDYTNVWTTMGGMQKWIMTTLSPVLDEEGNTIKIIGVESDFTEVKRVERTLEEKNKHLLSLAEHLEHTNKLLEHKNKEIESQKQRSDDLLMNIFPREVANQLKRKGEAKTKLFKMCSVLFTDFKGFSALTKMYSVKDLIKELSRYFEKIDEIIGKHFLEKIKTMGDAYMCVGGVPFRNNSNPINAVMAGLEIQQFMKDDMEMKRRNNEPIWQLRVGIHTGEVIAGVIGRKKFAYDIWGDTVNTASRMEAGGEVAQVNVSGDTYDYIRDFFECTPRGKIKVKKSIEMDMYFVNRLKEEYSEDPQGVYPNAAFRKILATF